MPDFTSDCPKCLKSPSMCNCSYYDLYDRIRELEQEVERLNKCLQNMAQATDKIIVDRDRYKAALEEIATKSCEKGFVIEIPRCYIEVAQKALRGEK